MLWSLGFSLSSFQKTSTRANGVLSSHESCSLFASRQKTGHNSSSGECVMKPMLTAVCWHELLWGTVWLYFFLCLFLPPDTTLEESDSQQVLVMEVYSTLTIAKLYRKQNSWQFRKIHRTSSKISVYKSTRWADTTDNQRHIRLAHIITSLLLMISSCWGGLKALIILQCFYNLHLY